MARNVEVKARISDARQAEEVIRGLTRAEPHVMHQEDTFYRVPRGRLKVRHDEHGESAVVYYLRADTPGPVLSRYCRRLLPRPAATMDELGRRYGVKAVVRKQRKLFMSGSTRIHLDCVEGLGDFVEIEVPVASMRQKAAAEDEARNLMRRLGIEPCDVLACAYEDLLAADEAVTAVPQLEAVIATWRLPEGDRLLDRVERMIRPALLAGCFGRSTTRFVAGLQYHLGGEQDTRELAALAGLWTGDDVLDICCFIGGPALQLADAVGCRVTGIDLDRAAIAAASRVAEVTGLTERLEFVVADAARLPFADATFTVVWSQCSLESDDRWLKEFDRVLAPAGRLALTFQTRGHHDQRWTLAEMVSQLAGMGYRVDHADDITRRDIEIGWNALDDKLSDHEDEFVAALGREWVRQAHREFRQEAVRMAHGEYGNGRVVATKACRAQAGRRSEVHEGGLG